jgi:hypothetical protein
MTDRVRGVWEFAFGDELPPADVTIKLDPVFIAYEFPDEYKSEKAWQRANVISENISLWRMSKPDYSAWQIVAMGESSKHLRKIEPILLQYGGKFWVPETGLIRALALRRYKTAFEETKKALAEGRGGSVDLRTEHRWGTDHPMRLNSQGEMEPYERED